MKEIILSNGQAALVDDYDFPRLSAWRWHYSGGYALRHTARPLRKTVWMHREIMQPATGQLIDHANQNKLDNRRENLRLASASQNGANVGRTAKNASGYKGVCQLSGRRKWTAQIQLNGEDHFLGNYETPEEAAKAYDHAARELQGEFANTNF